MAGRTSSSHRSRNDPGFLPTGIPQTPHRRCVVLTGTSGAGKSSLGNALLGISTAVCSDPSEGFSTSSSIQSCTQTVRGIDGYWHGDRSKPIRVIDTPSMDDHETPIKRCLIQDLLGETVHAFIWVKCAHSPRLYPEDLEFLDLFEKMFGPAFKERLVVVLTRFSFSHEEDRKRLRMGLTSDMLADHVQRSIHRYVTGMQQLKIPVHIVDALYNESQPAEVQMFQQSMNELWMTILEYGNTPLKVQNNMETELEVMELISKQVAELKHLRKSLVLRSNRQEEMKKPIDVEDPGLLRGHSRDNQYHGDSCILS